MWICNYIFVGSKHSLLEFPDQTWEAQSAFKHGKISTMWILYHPELCLYLRHKYHLQSSPLKEMEDMIILWVLLDPLAPGPLEALSDPGKMMKKYVKIGLALSCNKQFKQWISHMPIINHKLALLLICWFWRTWPSQSELFSLFTNPTVQSRPRKKNNILQAWIHSFTCVY